MENLKKQRWERAFELSSLGVIFFIGFVSLLYSWIDSAFGVKVNIILLTAAGIAVSFSLVYAIYLFDKD